MEFKEFKEDVYRCPKCGRLHTRMYRGKPSKIFEEHFKFYVDDLSNRMAQRIETSKIEYIKEDTPKQNQDRTRGSHMSHDSTFVSIDELTEEWIYESKKIKLKYIVESCNVFRHDGLKAAWKMEQWVGNGISMVFSPYESMLYAPLIAIAKGKSLGIFSKRKARNKLKKYTGKKRE